MACFERSDARLLDVLWGIEIGFTGGKVQNIFACRFEGFGLGVDREGR
jgi:hypothetical protein